MISNKEFVDYARGFVAALNGANPTPEAWKAFVTELAGVYDDDVLDTLRSPGTFRVYPTIPAQPYVHPNHTCLYPYIGDIPGWLNGPWQVTSTSAATTQPLTT
jgi:hypothetical protein